MSETRPRRARCLPVALACLLLVPALLLGGCAHVQPYEREYLAHPAMDTAQREAGQDGFYGHVLDAREGAGSMGDVAGGGCGCN